MIDFKADHKATVNARAFRWTGDEGTARGVSLPSHSLGNVRVVSPKTGKSMLFSRTALEVKDGELIVVYRANEPFTFAGRVHFRTFTLREVYAKDELPKATAEEMLRTLKEAAFAAAMSAEYAEGSWTYERNNIVVPLDKDVGTLQTWWH